MDVALEATERHGLGRAPGPAAGLGSADLLLQLGPAAQEVTGQAGVEQRGDAEREREGQQRDSPIVVMIRTSARRLSPNPSSDASVTGSVPRGMKRSQTT